MTKRRKAPRPAAALPAPSWRRNGRLHLLVVALLAAGLYLPTLTYDFALDDAIVLSDNEFTTQGFAGIDELFRYDTFRGFFKVEGKDRLVAGGRYRPLTPALLAVEVGLFGLRAPVHHLFNVLYYAALCALVYRLLLRLLSPGGEPRRANDRAYFIALAAALLFAVHPIHTEVVANIKGRDEIVTMLGGLGALYLSLLAVQRRRPYLHVLSGVAFFLGLLSKENAITFVAVVPLTFFIFTKTSWPKIALATAPYLAAAAVFLYLRAQVLGGGFGDESGELLNNPFLKLTGGAYVPFAPGEKWAAIFIALGKYLQLLVLPHPLTHDYYPRVIEVTTMSDWRAAGGLVLNAALAVYALLRLPRRDPVAYGIGFYFISLSIFTNVVVNIGTHLNERFAFVASLGFCFAIAVLVHRLYARRTGARAPVRVGLGLVLAVFAGLTVVRSGAWQDNYTLFTTDIATSPNSAKLRNSTGGALIERAIEAGGGRREELLREAVGHLRAAIRIHPGYKNAYLLLGNAQNYLQDFEAATAAYQRALQLDPDYAEARNNLGITYRDAGRYYGEQQNDLPKAIQNLERAYQLRPDEYETLRLLGIAYGRAGNNDRALTYFKKATTLLPGNADAWFNLGIAQQNAGRPAAAAASFANARAIDPAVTSKRGG